MMRPSLYQMRNVIVGLDWLKLHHLAEREVLCLLCPSMALFHRSIAPICKPTAYIDSYRPDPTTMAATTARAGAPAGLAQQRQPIAPCRPGRLTSAVPHSRSLSAARPGLLGARRRAPLLSPPQTTGLPGAASEPQPEAMQNTAPSVLVDRVLAKIEGTGETILERSGVPLVRAGGSLPPVPATTHQGPHHPDAAAAIPATLLWTLSMQIAATTCRLRRARRSTRPWSSWMQSGRRRWEGWGGGGGREALGRLEQCCLLSESL